MTPDVCRPPARREVIPRQTDILAWVSVAFAATLACIYPFIRKVDDLFNISTELIVVTVAVVVLACEMEGIESGICENANPCHRLLPDARVHQRE